MGKVLRLKPKKKKHRVRNTLIIVLVVVLVLVLWLNSRFWSVKEFVIEGNTQVSDEVILNDLNMEPGMNLIGYCLKNHNREFELSPRIRTADVYIQWPDSVKIVVTEKEVMGYIPYMGLYLCIDASGKVLDSTHLVEEGTPVLTGITVDSFSLGAQVDTKDTERFTIMLDCLALLKTYELSSIVTEVAVPSADDIHLYTANLEILCGGAENLDQKIAAAIAVMEDGTAAGILHVEDLEDQIYVEPR